VDADVDVAVVGGGPAGLAAAAFAVRAGLTTVVLEKRDASPDKACGEGVMPAGVHVLESLGVTARIAADGWHPFTAIRWVEADGTFAEGRLPGAGGRGIRRTALAAALGNAAAAAGAELRFGCGVEGLANAGSHVVLTTAGESVAARVVVCADGVRSRLRSLSGLDRPSRLPRRFGLRQHFHLAPSGGRVEVHVGDRVQAYVTPVGPTRTGVAFLWDDGAVRGDVTIPGLLRRFPALAERFAGAPPDSRPRGAGPLAQRCRARTADRLVLLGDAAGYFDAITGEGLSLALACAQALGAILPEAIDRGASRTALAPYERFAAREFRRYALVCRLALALSRRPRLRRSVLRGLSARPRTFDRLIALALS
jgi:2-polyprenyl-6-methoxyphenol hydroxylase-like FAD-dependent oxidoreductase